MYACPISSHRQSCKLVVRASYCCESARCASRRCGRLSVPSSSTASLRCRRHKLNFPLIFTQSFLHPNSHLSAPLTPNSITSHLQHSQPWYTAQNYAHFHVLLSVKALVDQVRTSPFHCAQHDFQLTMGLSVFFTASWYAELCL